jgi:two-component system LytT family response regulator
VPPDQFPAVYAVHRINSFTELDSGIASNDSMDKRFVDVWPPQARLLMTNHMTSRFVFGILGALKSRSKSKCFRHGRYSMGTISNTTSTIRTLIVDDEPLARKGIRVWLKSEHDIDVIGEATDGEEAVESIQKLKPDLLFLDVRMPGLDGFEVLERVAGAHIPLTIFVTAYDSHAIRAFEVNAVDYLLKPISQARLREALQRVRHELLLHDELEVSQNRLLRLLDVGATNTQFSRRFVVRDRDKFMIVVTDEIDWIESAANYVELHLGKKVFLLRETMRTLEARLDPNQFVRIHRSTIVNISRIKEITREWTGDFEVMLHDGTKLRMSRSYQDRLLT